MWCIALHITGCRRGTARSDWSAGPRPCLVQEDPPPAAAASQGCLKAPWARRTAHAPACSRSCAAWAANALRDGERCSGQLGQPGGVHAGVRLLRGRTGERVAVPVPVPDARRRWVKKHPGPVRPPPCGGKRSPKFSSELFFFFKTTCPFSCCSDWLRFGSASVLKESLGSARGSNLSQWGLPLRSTALDRYRYRPLCQDPGLPHSVNFHLRQSARPFPRAPRYCLTQERARAEQPRFKGFYSK